MLGDILELVKKRFDFEDNQALEIKSIAWEVCIELEPSLGKLYQDFMSYTDLERLLIADLTAFRCFEFHIYTKNSKSSGDFPIKKVKADVVEVEYDSSNSSSKQLLMSNLKNSICQKAAALGICLAMCSQNKDEDYPKPFKIFTK
ncbi:MAG: hypothetical protein OHK0045_22790 [Raineya sp.]